jgi:hypothetical protein
MRCWVGVLAISLVLFPRSSHAVGEYTLSSNVRLPPLARTAPTGERLHLIGRNETLTRFQQVVRSEVARYRAAEGRVALAANQEPPEAEVVDAIERIIPSREDASLRTQVSDDSRAIVAAALSPAMVIGGLVGLKTVLDGVIDGALENLDRRLTSQLVGLRGHVAGSIRDLELAFGNQLNVALDKLTKTQISVLNSVTVTTSELTGALENLQNQITAALLDSVCQLTIALADIRLLDLGFKRALPPDLSCMFPSFVMDPGPNHDQILTFRGVRLRPNGIYPRVTIYAPTSDRAYSTPVAGGDRAIQAPLAGGINGAPNDVSPRGEMVVLAQLDWPVENLAELDLSKTTLFCAEFPFLFCRRIPSTHILPLRWMFVLEPYIVRTVRVRITPLIREDVVSTKSKTCYISTDQFGDDGGSFTCEITSDLGNSVVDCSAVETTKAGGARFEGPDTQTGSCAYRMYVDSRSGFWRFKGGRNWLGIEVSIHQKGQREVSGATYEQTMVVNQSTQSAVFQYPAGLNSSPVIDWGNSWQVDITTNTGRDLVLTNSDPVHGGTRATINNAGQLTISFPAAFSQASFSVR